MPTRDGTGPKGKGRNEGRGLGFCSGTRQADLTNQVHVEKDLLGKSGQCVKAGRCRRARGSRLGPNDPPGQD